jgi:hypothetical protein
MNVRGSVQQVLDGRLLFVTDCVPTGLAQGCGRVDCELGARLNIDRSRATRSRQRTRGRSVAKAPRMSFRLEGRRPPPTVPSRTLVCRYLSAPESTMPLVKYSGRSGCRVSVLAAARSPLAEPGPFGREPGPVPAQVGSDHGSQSTAPRSRGPRRPGPSCPAARGIAARLRPGTIVWATAWE